MSNNEVKLSDYTLSVFKGLYNVDQSLKIDCDKVETITDSDGKETDMTVLRAKSMNKTMMARVEIPEIFPRDVYIYDLREFISVVNIVKQPTFDFSDDKFIKLISEDGKQTLRYLEANPDLINSFIEEDLSLTSEDCTIHLTEAQFKSVITASQTMKLEYIGFNGNGDTISLSAFNKNKGDNNETNNFNTDIVDSDIEMSMFFKTDVHNISVLLGEGDLTFTIEKKRKISKVQTESGKSFWIAFDRNSTFGD